MASCAYCDTTILFGGKKEGNLRFCNAECQQKGVLASLASQIPPQEVGRYLPGVHRGRCPVCSGAGPVDVHTSYRVWSALVLTSWSSRPRMSCRSCGTKRKVFDTLYSLVFGWWGMPWGLLITPLQVLRNLFGLLRKPDPSVPSLALEKMVRLRMAEEILASQRAQAKSSAFQRTAFDSPGG